MGRFVEEDIATYLESQVVWLRRRTSTVGGTQNFFIGDLPNRPIEAVGLFEYPGDQSIYFLGGGSPIERPRIQITARAIRYDRARELIHDIYDVLEDKTITVNGTEYLRVRSIGRPGEISPDAENNAIFSSNYMLWRQT